MFNRSIFLLVVIVAVASATYTIPANNAKYTSWEITDDLFNVDGGKLNFNVPSTGCVTFRVQGSNDLHFLMSSEHGVSKPGAHNYEIVLGGWSNTKSVIRAGAEGVVVDSYPKNKWMDGAVMSASEVRKFWICLTDGEISVGRGGIVYRDPIMTYTARAGTAFRFNDIKYMSVAAWDTPIVFHRFDLHKSGSNMQEFMVPGNKRHYVVWNKPNEIIFNTDDKFDFVFKCRGAAATIGFLPASLGQKKATGLGLTAPNAFEITLDAYNGTQTKFYYGTQATGGKLLSTFKTEQLLNHLEYRTFWIRKFGRAIMVGKGAVIGHDTIGYALIPEDNNLAEKTILGFTAWDFPTTYHFIHHESSPMPDDDEIEQNLTDYFDALTESKMETAMIMGGKNFHSELYEEWQKSTGERNLDKEDQAAWEDLQYKLAAQGNPDAIAIMTGTAPWPKAPVETAEQWETSNY